MQNKTFPLLVLVAVAGAVVTVICRAPVDMRDSREGQTLISKEVLGEVDRFELSQNDKLTELYRDEVGGWQVRDQTGYQFPANGEKIAGLLDSLERSRFLRLVYKAPDEKAKKLVGMHNPRRLRALSGERDLFDARLGYNRPKGLGVFLAMGSEERVYVSDRSLESFLEAEYWELRTLVNVPAEDVMRIRVAPDGVGAGVPVTLIEPREDSDKNKANTFVDEYQLDVVDLARDESGMSLELRQAPRALLSVEFEKKISRSDERLTDRLWKNAYHTEFTLRNGVILRFELATLQEGKIKISVVRGIVVQESDAASESFKVQLANLKSIFKDWVVVLPGYIADRFRRDRATFVAAKSSS